MATREERFRQAALAYLVYGVVYWLGGFYLFTRGVAVGGGVVWLLLGALLVVVVPWLVSRGARGRGYLWFVRILTLLVAYRSFRVARVALAPTLPSIPVPGGGESPMALWAWAFFLVTLVTAAMLARAAWGREP